MERQNEREKQCDSGVEFLGLFCKHVSLLQKSLLQIYDSFATSIAVLLTSSIDVAFNNIILERETERDGERRRETERDGERQRDKWIDRKKEKWSAIDVAFNNINVEREMDKDGERWREASQ